MEDIRSIDGAPRGRVERCSRTAVNGMRNGDDGDGRGTSATLTGPVLLLSTGTFQ
jgi:hypothetical protein